MNDVLTKLIVWVKGHRWLAAFWAGLIAAIMGAIANAIVSGAQSYAIAVARITIFGWHPLPAIIWCTVGSTGTLLVIKARSRFLDPERMPDESQGVRWLCTWDGRRVVKLEPLCPNPNCGKPLRITQAGGQYGSDAVLRCGDVGCGFHKRYEEIPAVVLADATRDLNGQAAGRPPAAPGKRKSRLWYG